MESLFVVSVCIVIFLVIVFMCVVEGCVPFSVGCLWCFFLLSPFLWEWGEEYYPRNFLPSNSMVKPVWIVLLIFPVWISTRILSHFVFGLPPHAKKAFLLTCFPNPDRLPQNISPSKFRAQSAEIICLETTIPYFIASYFFLLRTMGIKWMSGLEESLGAI